MKVCAFLNLSITFFILLSSCNNAPQKNIVQINKEADTAYVLKEVTIGKQIWANMNLTEKKFSNGDTIHQALTDADWQRCADEKIPCWCYYENAVSNNRLYGKLYNWYAVNDARGLAPIGWHVASEPEWQQLEAALIDSAGWKLKATIGWEDEPGNNASGFAAVGGGLRQPEGLFQYIDRLGLWWTISEKNSSRVFNIIMPTSNILGIASQDNEVKGYGYSVRCIKDKKMPIK